jgi:hypothetical protein
MQDLTKSKLAKMPSCNLAKMVYNKWLQQSSNCNNDLYVTMFDDLVQELKQVVRYYQYLKGEHACTSPGKEELQLRVAQYSAQ